jgi:hypothetical protein
MYENLSTCSFCHAVAPADTYQNHFQSEFSIEYELVFRLNTYSVFFSPQNHLVAAYVLFLIFPSLYLSFSNCFRRQFLSKTRPVLLASPFSYRLRFCNFSPTYSISNVIWRYACDSLVIATKPCDKANFFTPLCGYVTFYRNIILMEIACFSNPFEDAEISGDLSLPANNIARPTCCC